MKIIILGAGNVGVELARYLVNAGHAVTLIDNPSEGLSQVGSRLDLRIVEGNPSSPEVLRNAGAENAELLVAATGDDELNITACCVGAFLFRIPRKIARIRSPDYMQESEGLFGEHSIPIDHIISPEHIITDSIMRLIDLPGIQSSVSFCNDKVVVASARFAAGGKLLDRPIREFSAYDGHGAVLALYRNGKAVKEWDKNVFKVDDEIYFCCERIRLRSQLSAILPLGTGLRTVTISGGTHIASELARQLAERYSVKLIEPETPHATRTAEKLRGSGVEVYNADPVDIDFIMEEHLQDSDLFVAASPNDDTNVMSSLIISRLHKVRTLAVIRSDGYFELGQSSRNEIDTIISPNEDTISALLSTIRQEGVENTHLFRQGRSEALELKIEGTKLGSKVVGRNAASLTLPEGTTLGMVMRGSQVLPLTDDLIFEDGDRVIAYLDDHKEMRKLINLFRPRSFWLPKW